MIKKTVVYYAVGLLVLLLFPNKSIGILVTCNPNTEDDLAGYHAYFATTYQNAQQKNGDIGGISIGVVDEPSFPYEIDESIYDVVFVALTAFDTSGNESGTTICYKLYGNIVGGFFDGTPYTEARVDGMDLITLGIYFGQTTNHRSDLNRNGRVDGFDLIELGLKFGNTAY